MKEPADTRHIVVTGANRGLGLGFCRVWLEAGHRVVALARRPGEAGELHELGRRHAGRLSVFPCDVGDDASVAAAARRVEEAIDRLDLLVNNAGVYGSRESRLDQVDFPELHRVYEVNTIGPLRVTRAFLPLLRRGRGAAVVHVTSLMGSISDNGSGGSYPYRLSKAALNMASRNLALELRPEGILSAVIHPGWVKTGMGGPDAPLTIPESVRAMAKTIDSLTLDRTGGFFDRDGKSIDW